MRYRLSSLVLIIIVAVQVPRSAQAGESEAGGYSSEACPSCAAWNAPRPAFRIHGDTYYVGTEGLSAVLVTSDEGHILVDGGLPESAPIIVRNIESLGFRIEDVKLILNSHAHFDHAGGISALQQVSGAKVAASPSSAAVLERGASGPDDPQYGEALPFPAVQDVRVITDGETLQAGSLALTAHFTPGHTPGGTSWSWRECQGERCLDFVYADSQTPISADGFLFTENATYPSAIQDFERGFAVLEDLSCDVLVTSHPTLSGFWKRASTKDKKGVDAFVDEEACKHYAADAREKLARRIDAEEKS